MPNPNKLENTPKTSTLTNMSDETLIRIKNDPKYMVFNTTNKRKNKILTKFTFKNVSGSKIVRMTQN